MSTSDNDCHRKMAAALFNRTWELLDAADRSAEDQLEMLSAAYGSRYHWRQIGEPKNFSVSDWQVARVLAVAGEAGRAAEHAAESLRLAQEHDLGPFYAGYAHEALARAAAVAGDVAARDEHLAAARAHLAEIDDEDSAAMLQADLDELGS